MRSQRSGDRYIVRVESGEQVMEALTGLLRRERVGFANLSGAGAFRWARVGFWDQETKDYRERELEEQLEVVSFQGNASIRDGSPFLHLHVALGRSDLSVIGGHLSEAIAHPTLEVWMRAEDIEIRRSRDEATGLDLLDLPLDHGIGSIADERRGSRLDGPAAG